jgi:hypothetical protein
MDKTAGNWLENWLNPTAAYCTRAVNRLKNGPENIPKVMCRNTSWSDTTFEGIESIAWNDMSS